MPFTVDLELRLRLEAIVFAADTISNAYSRLFELSLKLGHEQVSKPDQRGISERIALFKQAWSIVDNVHNLRRLLPKLGADIDGLNEFVADLEGATLMRNRVDHLGQLLPNIAKSKESAASLYGSLSYVLALPQQNTHRPGTIFFVLQQTGAARPDQEMSIKVPSQFRLPAGNFVLCAFDWSFDLDDVILRLCPLIKALNASVEISITDQIRQKATELGCPESDLRAHGGANYCFMLPFNIGGDASGI